MDGEELLLEFDKLRVGQGNIEATLTETYITALANVMRKGKAITPWGFKNGPKRMRQIQEDLDRHRDNIEISTDGTSLSIEEEPQQ
jgi:hypothetical protein